MGANQMSPIGIEQFIEKLRIKCGIINKKRRVSRCKDLGNYNVAIGCLGRMSLRGHGSARAWRRSARMQGR